MWVGRRTANTHIFVMAPACACGMRSSWYMTLTPQQKEGIDGEEENMKEFTVFPHRDCDITPISMDTAKEQKMDLAFNNYRENILGNHSNHYIQGEHPR
jgi:hypothetical protein